MIKLKTYVVWHCLRGKTAYFQCVIIILFIEIRITNFTMRQQAVKYHFFSIQALPTLTLTFYGVFSFNAHIFFICDSFFISRDRSHWVSQMKIQSGKLHIVPKQCAFL